MEVKVQAPVNIALIKYWGKRNEELILPLNDSVSLSINELMAITTVTVGDHITEDSVTINDNKISLEESSRFWRVFKEVRSVSKSIASEGNFSKSSWHVRIVSETNFPVAAGLASSAAGFAAIACGIGRIFQLNEKEIIRLARIGSGSACRSVQSGFVHWRAGTLENDFSDGGCESIVGAEHWPELRAVVIVLDEKQKKVGSSVGMRATVQTSSLLKSRVRETVPQRVKELKEAILVKDFERLAKITMAESNQLHAVCLDTYPPLQYLNVDSRSLIEFVHDFNAYHDATLLAYTFDAGPNCCLILEEGTLPKLFASLRKCFNFDEALLPREFASPFEETEEVPSKLAKMLDGCEELRSSGDFVWTSSLDLNAKSIICSKVGVGPKFFSLKKVSDLKNSSLSYPPVFSDTEVSCKML